MENNFLHYKTLKRLCILIEKVICTWLLFQFDLLSVQRKDTVCDDASTSGHAASISKPQSSIRDQILKNGTLPNFFTGIHIHFHEVSQEQIKKLKRYIIAYPFCSKFLTTLN